MISTELERATIAYLTAVTGTLVDDTGDQYVDGGGLGFEIMPQGMAGYEPADEGGLLNVHTEDQVPVASGLTFRFYRGENNTDIKLPCAIISAQEASEDFDTGNETVQLTIAVHVPSKPYGTETDPISKLLEISEALINAVRRDDVADYLNLYRPDPERLSVIGCVDRSTAKSVEGTRLIHQINLTLYCAACDLESGFTQAGFAPPALTTAQRDAIPGETPVVIWNTETGTYQGRTAAATWQDMTTA